MSLRRALAAGLGAVLLAACAASAPSSRDPTPGAPAPADPVAAPPGSAAPAAGAPPPDPTKLPLAALPSGPIPTDLQGVAINSRILGLVSPPTAQEDLPLGAGDLIEVSVFEVPELSNLRIRIPLGGRIRFPLLGAVQALGRTPAELGVEIRDRLQTRFMHDPDVSVLIVEQQSHKVAVLGAVRKGGVYTFSGRLRVADALAMAEGLTPDADRIIYLIRRVPAGTLARARAGEAPVPVREPLDRETPTEEVVTAIDIEALAGGRDDLNVELQAGDVIHVPAAGSFYVGGEVAKPGTFPLKSRTTLDQAVVAAGGVTKIASWSEVEVYRPQADGRQEVLRFNLEEIRQGGETPPELKAGDVVLVGKSGGKSFAYGVLDFVKGIFRVGVGVEAVGRPTGF